MVVIKSLISAISTYSKIPMPNISYRDGDGRFTLLFFPVVGAVLAAAEYLWFLACWYFSIASAAEVFGYMILPVVVTGGIHLDGFMDCMDAIHSYGSKEKKLDILKDPHIGAFCVIKLLELSGVWFIAITVIQDNYYPLIFAAFFFSRVFSGISIGSFKLAKADGMVAYTRNNMSKACLVWLVIEGVIVASYMVYEFGLFTLIPLAVMVLCFIYYHIKSQKDFGGITGDTAGCYLVMSETAWILTLALINIWWMRR